ncbi:MAG: hypothetical protein D6732_28105 [Methanobacteriota archaeon]|nr:MAG: hypothetical protein D6732_28105 [Euryarchaeota archaeon]
MQNNMRKSDLLLNEVVTVRRELKEVQDKYGQTVSELALLTKADLVPKVKGLTNGTSVDEIRKGTQPVFEEIDNLLFNLQELQVKMDEIIQNMDGWDFADKTHEKILEILRDQETMQNKLRDDLIAIEQELTDLFEEDDEETAKEDVLKSLEDYLLDFSRLQDYVQEYIPKIEDLFDEIDDTLKKSMKYSNTRAI